MASDLCFVQANLCMEVLQLDLIWHETFISFPDNRTLQNHINSPLHITCSNKQTHHLTFKTIISSISIKPKSPSHAPSRMHPRK